MTHTNDVTEASTEVDVNDYRLAKRPCYRYIRASDRLPRPAAVADKNAEDIVCKVRLFNPTGSGTWWIAAYDPDTGIAFGAAEIFDREIGDFYMPELTKFRGMFNLPIERDLHYNRLTLAEVMKDA